MASASSMLVALAASIGRTGRPTSRPKASSASLPPASAAAATAPSEPRSIIARRTSATGTDAARATASVITPSSAPCRSSPDSSPTRNRCSAEVARPNSSPTSALRAAAEPFPATARSPRRPRPPRPDPARARPRAANPSRSAAQPTPICRCGSSPDRYATAIGTSSGPASRNARGQQVDLGQPGAGRAHGLRHLGDPNEQHPPILADPAACSGAVGHGAPAAAPASRRGGRCWPGPTASTRPGTAGRAGARRSVPTARAARRSPTTIATRPKMIRYQAL